MNPNAGTLNSDLSLPTLDAQGSEFFCEYKSNPTASHTQQSCVAIFFIMFPLNWLGGDGLWL